MTYEKRPLHEEVKECLDELARAHVPVLEWLEEGLRWLDTGEVSPRQLAKAECNCTRHVASLQDAKEVLRIMERTYPGFAASFEEARAGIEIMTLRLQSFLQRIRSHKPVGPDRPLYVVDVPLDELPDVVNAYTAVVEEQERDFAFFGMAPEFMDSALLHAELDSIEDGCEEHEGLAEALETKVAAWRVKASVEQGRLLSICEKLAQRLRFVQMSKREAVAKLRESTADAVVAAKLRRLVEEADDDALATKLH